MSDDERVSEADEERLAELIERWASEGAAAIDRVAGADRELARRLKGRIDALERLGLLAEMTASPRKIGRFRVLGELGRGGMGVVYLAVDERLDRRVAIKVAHLPLPAPDASASGSSTSSIHDPRERAGARFDREVRAAAQLEHPGIVRIYDVGEVDAHPYFAMEYIQGATLSSIVQALRERAIPFAELTPDVLREIVAAASVAGDAEEERAPVADSDAWGRTYIETVCRWTIAVADALAHAHSHGIVHRDVKPANIIVRRDGSPKVFDLGLARLEDQPGLTRSGELAGSPFYVSPEQLGLAPEDVDRRADVWSLGVTLYELLCLARPFEARTTAQVFRQIASKEPPLLRRVNPLVPRDLETICLTALEKDRSRRYPTMDEFASDLRRFLEFQPVLARPISPLRRTMRFVRQSPARAAALALAGVVVVGVPLGLLWANARVVAEEHRTQLAADRARHEANLKAKVTEYLVREFELTDDEREQGGTISARELLDRGVERLETEFEDQPEVRAALFEATGRVYANLGLAARAIPLLDRALALRQSRDDTDPIELSGLLDRLAAAHLAVGDAGPARLLAERGLSALQASGASESSAAADLDATLAETCDLSGDFEEARAHLERALAIRRATSGADSAPVGDLLAELGHLCASHGELERAEEHLSRALEIRRRAWSPDPNAIARTLTELSEIADLRGDARRARDLRSQATALTADVPLSQGIRLNFELEPEWRARYDAEFQDGITALQARRGEPAIASFLRCLALWPDRPVCEYNVACGYTLERDFDRAFAWLDRSVRDGFGATETRLQTFEADTDIAALRSDARFEPIRERMLERLAKAKRFADEEEVALPAGPTKKGQWPLFVVLHDDGATKRDVVAGSWRAASEAANVALIAPSGAFPIHDEPELGVRWLEESRDLLLRPMPIETRITDAVRRFSAHHTVDREHLWIGGEGTGAMVAFEVAAHAPGLFQGVLLVDGPIHPETSIARVRRAASMGLDVQVVLDAAKDWYGRPRGESIEQLASELRSWFSQNGFAERAVVHVVDTDRDASSRDRAIAEALKAVAGD